MSDFWAKRFEATPPVTATQKELSEVVARLPYRLYGPATITHLPLFGRSLEDKQFDELKLEFGQVLRSALIKLGEHDSVSLQKVRRKMAGLTENINVGIGLEEDAVPISAGLSLMRIKRNIFDMTIDMLKRFTNELYKNNFEVFAFECRQYILLDLNRRVHDEFISKLTSPEEKFEEWTEISNLSSELTSGIYKYINLTISAFVIFLMNETVDSIKWLESRKKILDPGLKKQGAVFFPATEPERGYFMPENDMVDKYNHQNALGGLVSLLKARHKKYEKQLDLEGITVNGTEFTDRRLLYMRLPEVDRRRKLPVPSQYVVWDRGNSSWRYTFYQGSSQPEVAGDGGTRFKEDVLMFVKRLMSDGSAGGNLLSDSGVEEEWETISAQFQGETGYAYGFPGRRHGGATYMIFDIELIVVLLFSSNLKLLDAAMQENLDKARDNLGDAGRQRIIDLSYEITNSLRDPRRDKLSNVGPSKHFAALCDALQVAERDRDPISSICINIKYASRVESKLDIHQQIKRRASRACALMLEALWKATMGEGRWIDESDFIASSVIDGRAIYFSNFRPDVSQVGASAPFGLTRTFFLDLGLDEFQRGRLVRRLVDLATYRLACVRDFERIRALGYGLNEIHDDLGKLQRKEFFVSRIQERARNDSEERRSAKEKSRIVRETLAADRATVNTLLENLVLIQRINIRLSQYNAMVTGGITDRRASTSGHLNRIRSRLGDLREERIHGYARLDEFVERGVARAVTEVSRTAQRYETLRERSQAHLVTITTQIAAVEAKMFSNFSAGAHENLTELKDLFAKADLLIIVGGAYYILSIFVDKANFIWLALIVIPVLFALKIAWPAIDRFFTDLILLAWDYSKKKISWLRNK